MDVGWCKLLWVMGVLTLLTKALTSLNKVKNTRLESIKCLAIHVTCIIIQLH